MVGDGLELTQGSWSPRVASSENRMDLGMADLGLPVEACCHLKLEPQKYLFHSQVESC